MHNKANISEFLKLLSLWKQAYKWKTTAFVGIKNPDGPTLLFGRIIFDYIKPNEDLLFDFESSHLIAGREIVEIDSDNIEACIRDAEGGKLVAAGKSFSLHNKEDKSMGTAYYPIHHPSITLGPRIPSLIIYGGQKNELISIPNFRPGEMLDWDLKSADQPFESLNELLTHLHLPTSDRISASTLEIIANSPISITDKSVISEGIAQVQCRVAKGMDTDKIKFGYKTFHVNNTERGKIDGSSFTWDEDASSLLGSATIATQDAPIIQAFLSYDGVALHQWWIDDPEKRLNPRHAIHNVFDDGLRHVKEFLLTAEGRKNHAFEHGMALLINIFGFSTSHYGKLSNMQDGPDILAITPTGNVVVIECTTGLINTKDKLAKLVQRTTVIKEQLVKAGHGHLAVQPVIVTAMKRNEVEADLERAGENGIAVICRENIEELLSRVGFPLDPEALFLEAQRLIPRIKQPPLFEPEA